MKTLLLLAFFCLFSLTSISQSIPLQHENLRGKVKSIVETYKKVHNDSNSEEFIWHYEYGFNRNGNILKWAKYYQSDILKSREEFEYERKTKRLLTRLEYDSHAQLINKNYFEYNDKGNIIEIWNNFKAAPNKRTLILSVNYTFDGLWKERITYDELGEIQSVSNCTYSESGFSTSSSLLIVNSGRKMYFEKNLNHNGFVLEIKTFNESHDLTNHTSYLHDGQGNVKAMNAYNSDGSSKFKTTIEYEYDKYLNWIKKTTNRDGNFSVIERKIKYYR